MLACFHWLDYQCRSDAHVQQTSTETTMGSSSVSDLNVCQESACNPDLFYLAIRHRATIHTKPLLTDTQGGLLFESTKGRAGAQKKPKSQLGDY